MAIATIRIRQPIPSILPANFQRNPRLLPSCYCFCHSCKVPPLQLNCTKPSNLNCFFTISNPNFFINHYSDQDDNILEEDKKSIGKGLAKIILEALVTMVKPAAMVVFLAGLWLFLAHDPSSALAASGGRIGGGSFSSSRSSSRSSSSYPSSSSSYRSSSPSYTSSSSGSSSYSSSISSSPSFPSDSDLKVNDLILFFAAIVLFFYILFEYGNGVSNPSRKISVFKVQVGLLGSAKSLQRDLNRIAETADASTPEGLKYILDETLKTLLKHPQYWAYGYSSSDIKNSMHKAETRFKQLSVDERGKFDRETLVNVNNMKQKYSMIKRENKAVNEFIVVTILVAVENGYQLSAYTRSDLDRIMRNLLSIYPGDIVAVEVLWTPQEENDVLSKRDLLDNYPLLRPL